MHHNYIKVHENKATTQKKFIMRKHSSLTHLANTKLEHSPSPVKEIKDNYD